MSVAPCLCIYRGMSKWLQFVFNMVQDRAEELITSMSSISKEKCCHLFILISSDLYKSHLISYILTGSLYKILYALHISGQLKLWGPVLCPCGHGVKKTSVCNSSGLVILGIWWCFISKFLWLLRFFFIFKYGLWIHNHESYQILCEWAEHTFTKMCFLVNSFIFRKWYRQRGIPEAESRCILCPESQAIRKTVCKYLPSSISWTI